MTELICLYFMIAGYTTVTISRPEEASHWDEWAALLAGALWPLVVAVRLTRWIRRQRRGRG